MNIRFLIAWLALGLLATGGCAEGPKVLTDFKASVEFSAFRTFAFTGLTDRGYQGMVLDNTLLRKRFEEMVGQQLTAKGLQQVGVEDRSDLLVHFFFGVKDKQNVGSTGKAGGGRHGKKSATSHEPNEGTLIVDLAESSKKELVWRAVIVESLGDNWEENFDMANKGVAKAFEDYPPAKEQ
jgi:hypothetical protein